MSPRETVGLLTDRAALKAGLRIPGAIGACAGIDAHVPLQVAQAGGQTCCTVDTAISTTFSTDSRGITRRVIFCNDFSIGHVTCWGTDEMEVSKEKDKCEEYRHCSGKSACCPQPRREE